MNRKILLLPGAHSSPSARYRIIQFYQPFLENGYHVKMRIPTPDRVYNTSNPENKFWHKVPSRLSQFCRIISTFWVLRDICKWDVVIANRDVVPDVKIIFFEKFVKFFKVKLIIDIDDAVYLGSRKNKMDQVFKLADVIVCGNETLQQYVAKINPNTVIIPTVVDTDKFKPNSDKPIKDKIVIGWMGSSGPAKLHLPMVYPALIEISKMHISVELLFVSDIKPEIPVLLKNVRYVKWTEDNEIELLQQMDIGLMPLPDNEFERGKCGFKAIQYMSVGIPALVSPVGVNRYIVADGEDGFYCSNDEDWIKRISFLCLNRELSRKMGAFGRIKTVDNYSTIYAITQWEKIIESEKFTK